MLATVMRKDKTATAPTSKAAKAPSRKQSFSAALSSRKEKVNVVSKASLAMLNPRLAMGMESSDGFDSTDTRGSREWSAVMASLKNASKPVWNDEASAKWTASPTPELEAFTMDDIVLANPMPMQVLSPPPPPMPWPAGQLVDDTRPTEAEPLPSPTRSQKLSSKASNGTLSRLFSRKKGGKAPKVPWNLTMPMPGLALSQSAGKLAMPQSAPPTTTTFDLSGGPLQFSHSDTWALAACGLSDIASLPASPVRDVGGLDLSPILYRDSPKAKSRSTRARSTYRLSRVQSLPSIRVHDIAMAGSQEATPAVPALSKPKLIASATSPTQLSSPVAWASTFGKRLDDCETPTLRPTSRYVSSTGRGVPSFSPGRFKDLFSPQPHDSTFGGSSTTKFSRRRSRSLGASNAPPRLSRFGSPPTIFSPPSPSLDAFLPEIATPDLSEVTQFTAQHKFTPPRSSSKVGAVLACSPLQRPSLSGDDSASSSSGSSCRSSLEEPDAAVVIDATGARREDLTQRARALQIASPSLSAVARSPYELSQSAFMVTVMPPTPDLGAEATPRMGDSGPDPARFESPVGKTDGKDIVVDSSSPPRRIPRSASNGSPSARIKARRDTVVINNTYVMPQYQDFGGVASQPTPKMSFDYFDAVALQHERLAKASLEEDVSLAGGLRRERHESCLSDYTETSELSSSASSSGPFGLAQSLSSSSLAHSRSSSTIGFDSPTSSPTRFELMSLSTLPERIEQVVRRYKFASKTPLDFNLPRSNSSGSLAAMGGGAASTMRRASEDEGSDQEHSELGYMRSRNASPGVTPVPMSSGATAEVEDTFKADVNYAGMYLNSNRMSVLSNAVDAALSAHLDLNPKPSSLCGIEPSTSSHELQRPSVGLACGIAGFARSASVDDLRMPESQLAVALPPRSMSSDHGFGARRTINGQTEARPAIVPNLPAVLSSPDVPASSSSPAYTMRGHEHELIHLSHTAPCLYPHDMSSEADHRIKPETRTSLHAQALADVHALASSFTDPRRPVLVVPPPSGLNRVRSSKVATEDMAAHQPAQERRLFQPQRGEYTPAAHAYGPAHVQLYAKGQDGRPLIGRTEGSASSGFAPGGMPGEPVSPRWRPESQESAVSERGYVMAL